MAKTDGGTKVIHTVKDAGHAQKIADALNRSAFSATNSSTGFVFGIMVQSQDTLAITASGPWHLPGSQRPAHGTMQVWAQGYAACLTDNGAQ